MLDYMKRRNTQNEIGSHIRLIYHLYFHLTFAKNQTSYHLNNWQIMLINFS